MSNKVYKYQIKSNSSYVSLYSKLIFLIIFSNLVGSLTYLGTLGNVLNPSPGWWFDVLLS
jgi:hypothetical protein